MSLGPLRNSNVGLSRSAQKTGWRPLGSTGETLAAALTPEIISALQDFVEAGKSASQAAKHLGTGRSTAYKEISETI